MSFRPIPRFRAYLGASTPQVVALFVDRDEHLIQMPCITRTGTAPTQSIRIGLAELPAPFADGFVRDDDAPGTQELFDVTVAQREAKIQLDSVADDLTRKPMMFVWIGCGWGHQVRSLPGYGCMNRATPLPEECMDGTSKPCWAKAV